MNDTTGFLVPDCLMKSAASSSAVPPISPIMMMPSVCSRRAEQSPHHPGTTLAMFGAPSFCSRKAYESGLQPANQLPLGHQS